MLLHIGHRPARLRRTVVNENTRHAGEVAYKLRLLGLRWYDVAIELSKSGVYTYVSRSAAANLARRHALLHGITWPAPLPEICGNSHIGVLRRLVAVPT